MFWKLATLCVFLGTLEATQSLKCYVCNSHIDGNCLISKPSERYLVDCTDATAQPHQVLSPEAVSSVNSTGRISKDGMSSGRNYTFCRKNVATIPEQANKDTVKAGEIRVLRSCGWMEPVGDVCKWAAEGHYEMCSCTKDACNSASTLGLHLFSYGLFLVFCRAVM